MPMDQIDVRLPSPSRIVVLASGTGSVMQALLDAAQDPGYGAQVVAVVSDRPTSGALQRAEAAGVAGVAVPLRRGMDRAAWDMALTDAVAGFSPDLVVSAGFMRLLGAEFLARFGGRTVNTHPALCPSFPGMHGVADAHAYGVKVTGASLFLVTAGVDDGPLLAQRPVLVTEQDTTESLHERIKVVEREMLVDTVGRMVRCGWRVDGRKATVL